MIDLLRLEVLYYWARACACKAVSVVSFHSLPYQVLYYSKELQLLLPYAVRSERTRYVSYVTISQLSERLMDAR